MVLGFQVEHTFKRRMSVWFRSVGFWLKGCGIFHQLTTNTYHLALSMNDLLKALCKKLRISFQSPNSVLGKPSSKGILPQPFDWCKIPVGKAKLIPDKYDKKNYYLKEDTIIDVPAFLMAKYPVTNAQ